MKCARLLGRGAALAAALALGSVAGPALGATTYGTLSNFDVINDTGQETHGFEIELDGVSPGDVVYTFGAPYERYGNPAIVPIAGGVVVRYASSYSAGAWAATTPKAISPYPVTMGHQCWTGGDSNYLNSGCEHFGISLLGNPTKTIYRWLIADSTKPGTLTPIGSNVSIPAPVWNVIPQPPPAPGLPPPPPIVVAVVEAPPPPPIPPGGVGQWGEAIWEKIYKTELPEAVNLEDLVLGGRAVPDPDVEPPEIEWQILQSPPLGSPPGAHEQSENGGDAPVADGKESVSRRYEFYKYTGQYDVENHEALCDNPIEAAQQVPDRCGSPDGNGVAGVGDLIGAQNAAVNLAAVPECAPDVTGSIAVARAGYTFNFATQRFYQKVTLTNTGGSTLIGPITLVLDNLSSNAQLFNSSGTTGCAVPLGKPYVSASIASLSPGARTSLLLQFTNPTKAKTTYNTRVLAGPGTK